MSTAVHAPLASLVQALVLMMLAVVGMFSVIVVVDTDGAEKHAGPLGIGVCMVIRVVQVANDGRAGNPTEGTAARAGEQQGYTTR